MNEGNNQLRNPWGIFHQDPLVDVRYDDGYVPFGFVFINDTRMKFSPAIVVRPGYDLTVTLILFAANWGDVTHEEGLKCVEALRARYPDKDIAADVTLDPVWHRINGPWNQATDTSDILKENIIH